MPKKPKRALSLSSRWIILFIVTILAWVPLVVGCPANAAYTFTQLDVPGATGTVAQGINSAGEVVGFFFNSTGNHGFLYTGGSFTQINVPGGSNTQALGINDAGQIVGTFFSSKTGDTSFLDTAGNFTQLDVPSGSITQALGINSAGQIVGDFSNGTGTHGFQYTDGSFSQLDIPGAIDTAAHGINGSGEIVGNFFSGSTGEHGFLYTGGSFTQLDVPGASVFTRALGINDAGQIVGGFSAGTGIHGFVDTGGRFTQLDVPGGSSTQAFGINDAGQIVGWFEDAFFTFHGFLATGGVEGDPHFTTFDGLRYDYQGVGDFVLTRSTAAGDPFDIQIRTTRSWHDGADVSIISEAAVKACNHRVTFDLDRTNIGGSFVWIDDQPSSLSADNPVLALDACKVVEISPDHYQVIWNTGEILDVSDARPCIDLTFTLAPQDGPGSVGGLLGNDNGWSGDDFQLPDGTFLNPQSATGDFCDVFADAWRVTAATSLLDPIPEPGTLTLLGIGLVGLGLFRRRAISTKAMKPKRARSALSLNSRWIILSTAAPLATAPVSSPANAAYTFSQIDVPGGFTTEASGINDAEQIVGVFQSKTGRHGFLDTGGIFTQLDVPGAVVTQAFGINAAGQIVGYFSSNTGTHGFLDTGGSFTQIDVPGARFGTQSFGINGAGQIVGSFNDSSSGHGFLDTGGRFTQVDVPGGFGTVVYGINDAGQIVGQFSNSTGTHGFLDTDGSFTQLDVPGGFDTLAFGINDAGQIVGYFFATSNTTDAHGFLDTGGSFTQLDVPGASTTLASGINDAGQIVGLFSNAPSTGIFHGFLATGGVEGDPHFTTFDGLHYNYQGVGDFLLARSTVDQFDVQVRTTESFWNGPVPVSFIAAAAATLCNHDVTFDVARASAGGSFVLIDGSPSSLSVASPVLNLGTCRISELSPEHYQVVWDTGEMLDVTDNFAQQGGMSAYYLDLSSQLSWIDGLGSVEGLLSSELNPDAWRLSAATSLLDPVPEPGTLTLLGIGLAGLGIIRRRATRANPMKPKKARSALSLNSRWIILSTAAALATAPLAVSSLANAANTVTTNGFLDTDGTFTQIDVPGATDTYATGVNDAGQIVGCLYSGADGCDHGFLYTGGSFTHIDVPGSSFTQARGINDAGQIVGSFENSTGLHGFLDTGGTFTQIDVPASTLTSAYGINDPGQIVGWFQDSSPPPNCFVQACEWHGFLDTGGSFTQIDVPGSIGTQASGINDAGQILGVTYVASATGDPHFTTYGGVHYDYQGVGDFLLARSTVDQFDVQIRTTESFWNGPVPVSFMTQAAATLCNHNVTFDVDRASAGGSFVWIDGSPSSLSVAGPVLNLGTCRIDELSPEHYQVVWNTGETLDVTDNFAQQNGMSVSYLALSSQLSWIDGLGSIEGLLSSDLNPDAWRLTAATSLLDPVPEPGTLTLLGAALAGVIIIRRRARPHSRHASRRIAPRAW